MAFETFDRIFGFASGPESLEAVAAMTVHKDGAALERRQPPRPAPPSVPRFA